MAINGVERAKVINSMDPLQKGRVQLLVPSVPGAGQGTWAPSCVAGLRIGDDVIIAFEGGSPNFPVVVGKLSA
jgi:hypothetical protein